MARGGRRKQSDGDRAAAPNPVLREAFLLGAIVLVTVAIYFRILHGEFQYDDFGSIVENQAIRRPWALLAGLLPALLEAGRPLTSLTFGLNYAGGGLDPFGYHLVNLAVHLAAATLVWLFTRAALELAEAPRPSATSLVVAALFAIHPLQTQAVSYISQRAESLASAFYLAAMVLLITAERRGWSWSGLVAYAAGIAAFIFGLGAKVIVVTLPVAYLLFAWVVPSRNHKGELTSWPRRLAMILPWAALEAVIAARTLREFEGRIDVGFQVPTLPPITYFLTQWQVVATYLRLLFFPIGQILDWRFPRPQGITDPSVLAAGAFHAALFALAAWLFITGRRGNDLSSGARRVAAFGIAWFFLLVAPTSSVLPLADVLMEHRIYLASWGIFVAVAVAGERLLSSIRWPRTAVLACVGVVLLSLAVLTWRRNAVWETRVGLWTDEVERQPANWRAHLGLGVALSKSGQAEAALREFQTAYDKGGASAPANAGFILKNIGAELFNLGRRQEAVEVMRKSLELRPDDPITLFNLANAARLEGRNSEAESLATRALELRPDHAPSMDLVAHILLSRREAPRALALFRRVSEITPEDDGPRFNAGVALEIMGRTDEACAAWRSVEVAPKAPVQLRELARSSIAKVNCAH